MAPAFRRDGLHTFSLNVHHSLTKRSPRNLRVLLSCPLDGDFAWEVLEKWASSALRNMTSILPGAQTSDPCRGFGPSPQRPHSAPSLAMPLAGDFAWEVLEKWASSALRNMTSLLAGAQTSDPCRGFEPSPQRPHSAPFLAMPLDGDFGWKVFGK